MKKDRKKSSLDSVSCKNLEKASTRNKKPTISSEDTKKKKKPWEKPQLIVFYRARPEESVLIACKGKGNLPAGPGFIRKCRKGQLWCSENSPS